VLDLSPERHRTWSSSSANPCTCMGRRGAPVLEGQPLGPSTVLRHCHCRDSGDRFWYQLTRLNCISQLQSTPRRRSVASIRMLSGRCIDHVRHQEALMPGLRRGQSPPILRRSLLKNLPLHENGSDLSRCLDSSLISQHPALARI
jgi:hypothetical protein